MLYTLRLLISHSRDSQKMKSTDSKHHKLIAGFCLKALEMSRFRLSFATKQPEQDWLEKLEMDVVDFLFSVQVDDLEDAVTMYVRAVKAASVRFYAGTDPLVMFDVLCRLCTRNLRLEKSLSRDLLDICAQILLSSTSCIHKLTSEVDYYKPGYKPGVVLN